MIDACRSCGAPIRWLVHATTGKTAPIDAEAAPRGNLVLLRGGRYRVVGRDEIITGPRYWPHFATCPHRARWRSGKGKP